MNKGIFTKEASQRPYYMGSFKRHIAGLIDAAVVLVIYISVHTNLPEAWLSNFYQVVQPEFYIFFLLVLYRLISFLYFDRTFGMKFCSMIYLNDEEEKASVKEKLFASFFILINRTSNYQL